MLRLRAPGARSSVADLLSWLGPLAAAARTALAEGRVRVEGRVARRAGTWVEAGAPVEIDLDAGAPGPALAGPLPGWALVAALPWRSGRLPMAGGRLTFHREEERDGVSALHLAAERGALAEAADALAAVGYPVLGDVRHECVLVPGGPRAGTGGRPDDAWPSLPIRPPAGSEPPRVRVSAATARALRGGHPWVLRDRELGDVARWAPGSLVLLEGRRGEPLGLARTEGRGRLAARRWDPEVRRPRDAASVEARVARALAARAGLLADDADDADDATDAYRLVHGEADGLPGLFVDRLGPSLRVLRTGRACEPVLDRVLSALARHPAAGAWGGTAPVVEVLQLAGQPPDVEAVRVVREPADGGPWPRGPLHAREAGLRFEVDLGLADPCRPRPGVGLFADQRENRRLARTRAGAGRWLNLFAHTGAFSLALLAGGAGEVVSVDLSAAYLRWLERNLAANPELPAERHRSVKAESRHFVESLGKGERFDGIVLDPPTAAAAGRRFWSVRRDLEPLVAACLGRLAPGGWLLVARNDREAARRDPRAWLSAAAARAGVPVAEVHDAPPGADFPALPGFPEGTPFRAVWLRRV